MFVKVPKKISSSNDDDAAEERSSKEETKDLFLDAVRVAVEFGIRFLFSNAEQLFRSTMFGDHFS